MMSSSPTASTAVEMAPGLVWVLAEEPVEEPVAPAADVTPVVAKIPQEQGASKAPSRVEATLLVLAYYIAVGTLALFLDAVEFLDGGAVFIYLAVTLLFGIWLMYAIPVDYYEPERPPCAPSRIDYTGR